MALAVVSGGRSERGAHHAQGRLRGSTVITEDETQPAAAAGMAAGATVSGANSTAPAGTSSDTTGQEGQTGVLSRESYDGPGYTAEVPSGWRSVEDGVQKEGYKESKWENPIDRDDYVLIDSSSQSRRSPFRSESPAEEAAPVHHDLEKQAGYEELAYSTIELDGTPTQEWVFRVPGSQRVDYFFQRCTSGFGVLGSTTSKRFAKLAPTFQAIAQSVHPSCE